MANIGSQRKLQLIVTALALVLCLAVAAIPFLVIMNEPAACKIGASQPFCLGND